jgi:hypothetical protein
MAQNPSLETLITRFRDGIISFVAVVPAEATLEGQIHNHQPE